MQINDKMSSRQLSVNEFIGPLANQPSTYIEEYENGDTVTKEEYEAFVAANPTLLEDITALTPINIAKIAALNTQIATMVDEINKLADEIGIDAIIDLGSNGVLSLNSDWDSSRC